jgi:hypothetical protein
VTEDPSFYDRALRRMDHIALFLGTGAVLVFLAREGWRGGLGCGLTAVASIYNLRRLKRVAANLSGGSGNRSGSGAAVMLGLRYLVLGGMCFVIIRFLGVSLPAVFAGLLISVAAVLVEIIYELIFIR